MPEYLFQSVSELRLAESQVAGLLLSPTRGNERRSHGPGLKNKCKKLCKKLLKIENKLKTNSKTIHFRTHLALSESLLGSSFILSRSRIPLTVGVLMRTPYLHPL